MKYLITESQYKLISELERDWMDAEYKDEYESFKPRIISHFENLIDGYSKNKSHITLYDSDDTPIMRYNKKSGELYYDKSLNDRYEDMFPHPFWMINAKYLMSDVFEKLLPEYKVKRVMSAHIS